MRHHNGHTGFFFKIHTRRKEIALILVISMCLPYLSATFLEHYEQRRTRQAAELLQEQQQQALEEQNTALEHFSELVTRSDYTAALDEINHLLSLDSANPQYYLKRAGLQVLLHNTDAAVTDLDTTIRLDPALYDAYQLRAQLSEENADYQNALADYQTMYALDPAQADVLMYIADCYQQQMDYENAINAYNTAETALPEYREAIAYARGVCRYSTEDFKQALADFLKYADTDPADGELNFLIGSCYMNLEQGDYPAAISYLTTAIEAGYSVDLASYNRGICYLHTDQADLAAADFEYVMANSTDSQLKTDTQSILDQLKQ